VTNVSG